MVGRLGRLVLFLFNVLVPLLYLFLLMVGQNVVVSNPTSQPTAQPSQVARRKVVFYSIICLLGVM